MLFLLFLGFFAVAITEIYLIISVSQYAGVFNTVFLLILVTLFGAWMVRRQGLSILRHAQTDLAEGRMPGRSIVDGILVVTAGVFMLTPGFATDILGFLLLLPFIRIVFREVLIRRFANKLNLD
tara:strand:- start:278 stop:649 length:372 start_codon:yes stop_codon:yes gene_type:complete